MATGIPARLSAREGRRFAWTVGAAFLVLAALLRWRDVAPLAVAIPTVLGAALGLAGLLAPGSLTGVHRAWMGLARVISRVTTPLFLGLTYFLVITPIGLLRRTLGRHPLVVPLDEDSYFVRRPEGRRRGNLERQF